MIDCVEWGGRKCRGYGMLGKGEYAHRRAYQDAYGPIPEGLHVLHRCDNPGCVNPAHLFLGTHLDNMRDRKAKGRYATQPKGEATYNCKLTDEQVGFVRSQRAEGCRLKDLAAYYGVSQSLISQVARGIHRMNNAGGE